MTDPLARWWVHEVGVRRLTGSGAGGDVYTPAPPAAPESVPCFVRDGTKLVRAMNGSEVVSTVQIAYPAAIARIPVGSKVTLPALFGGRTSTVISSSVGDGGGLPTPDHNEAALQ